MILAWGHLWGTDPFHGHPLSLGTEQPVGMKRFPGHRPPSGQKPIPEAPNPSLGTLHPLGRDLPSGRDLPLDVEPGAPAPSWASLIPGHGPSSGQGPSPGRSPGITTPLSTVPPRHPSPGVPPDLPHLPRVSLVLGGWVGGVTCTHALAPAGRSSS